MGLLGSHVRNLSFDMRLFEFDNEITYFYLNQTGSRPVQSSLGQAPPPLLQIDQLHNTLIVGIWGMVSYVLGHQYRPETIFFLSREKTR